MTLYPTRFYHTWVGELRFIRCAECEAIAVFRREGQEGEVQYACRQHAEGEGWRPMCSAEGCDRQPLFRVDYRMGVKHAHLTVCPEHFQILPDDRFDVFRMD